MQQTLVNVQGSKWYPGNIKLERLGYQRKTTCTPVIRGGPDCFQNVGEVPLNIKDKKLLVNKHTNG
jgi:hypothetical protein